MALFGAAHGWWGSRLEVVTHIPKWWNLAQFLLACRRSEKIHKSGVTLLEFCWHQHFSPVAIFVISRNKDENCILIHSLWLFWLLINFFNQHDCILMMAAKLATSDLEIKPFLNKGSGVKISVYDVTNKVLLSDSNNIIDLLSWLKFGKAW